MNRTTIAPNPSVTICVVSPISAVIFKIDVWHLVRHGALLQEREKWHNHAFLKINKLFAMLNN